MRALLATHDCSPFDESSRPAYGVVNLCLPYAQNLLARRSAFTGITVETNCLSHLTYRVAADPLTWFGGIHATTPVVGYPAAWDVDNIGDPVEAFLLSALGPTLVREIQTGEVPLLLPHALAVPDILLDDPDRVVADIDHTGVRFLGTPRHDAHRFETDEFPWALIETAADLTPRTSTT